MILAATREHAARSRRQVDLPGLFSYYKSEWLQVSPAEGGPSPLVYLVEQPPGSVLPGHFHRQNQFQVFVAGDGTFAGRPIEPGLVHYANAYTGYGPIVAGSEGLQYFTLRGAFDSGAFMIDSQGSAMVRGPKRNLHAVARPDSTDYLGWSNLFPPQIDELQAERISVPSGCAIACPRSEGLGTFYFVLRGGMLHAGRLLTRHESLYLSPGESGVELAAAAGGAEILRLQVPSLAPEYVQ